MEIFNRKQLRLKRERAASKFASHDFLQQIAAEIIIDRLNDTSREFSCGLNLNAASGQLIKIKGNKINKLIQTDLSLKMLQQSGGDKVVCDEELIPFTNAAFDLVVSSLGLHSVNDLPGALVQIHNILQKDGVFIGVFFGGKTLYELRQTFLEAELALDMGVSPHVMQFADIKDAGMLMQRAGFAMSVADSEQLTVTYENILSLMNDLRYMGETNILKATSKVPLTRKIIAKLEQIYSEKFADSQGRLLASFEFLVITGISEKN